MAKAVNKLNQTNEDVFVELENSIENLGKLVLKTRTGVKSPLDNIL
ncbi:MAG: hypothetical protein IPH11_08720 [Ignavibacteriales bacterium]|nr:hypothetical protein [Ignavibacteriales bacterium]